MTSRGEYPNGNNNGDYDDHDRPSKRARTSNSPFDRTRTTEGELLGIEDHVRIDFLSRDGHHTGSSDPMGNLNNRNLDPRVSILRICTDITQNYTGMLNNTLVANAVSAFSRQETFNTKHDDTQLQFPHPPTMKYIGEGEVVTEFSLFKFPDGMIYDGRAHYNDAETSFIMYSVPGKDYLDGLPLSTFYCMRLASTYTIKLCEVLNRTSLNDTVFENFNLRVC